MARLTHAPDITLIYESGTIGTAPDVLPLSIGDGELSDTALTTVAVPEMFRYWLQGGRVSIGFLGAAQLDRFGNINTTVIGDYAKPKTRLPGGGGAPEIATSSGEIYITMKQSLRADRREDAISSPRSAMATAATIASARHRDQGTDAADHRPRVWGPIRIAGVHRDLAASRRDASEVQKNCGWKVRSLTSCETTAADV